MKQKLSKIFHVAIALIIGALAMTVYLQHRELTQQQVDWSPIPMGSTTLGLPASPTSYPTPPPVEFGNRTSP